MMKRAIFSSYVNPIENFCALLFLILLVYIHIFIHCGARRVSYCDDDMITITYGTRERGQGLYQSGLLSGLRGESAQVEGLRRSDHY